MTKEQQTDQVKLRLYRLTEMFVKHYQPLLYYQFRGEQADLVSDFYTEFLTPKSRVKGKEQTLLDKFDDSITTLEYLVKVSVQRKLIDASRKDKGERSFDALKENLGESYMDSYVSGRMNSQADIDHMEFDVHQMMTLCDRYDHLCQAQKDTVNQMYAEVRNVISPVWRERFDQIIEVVEEKAPEVKKVKDLELSITAGAESLIVKIQQITDKTICALFKGEIIGINRFTGQGRSKRFEHIHLVPESLALVSTIDIYKSGLDRMSFIKKYGEGV